MTAVYALTGSGKALESSTEVIQNSFPCFALLQDESVIGIMRQGKIISLKAVDLKFSSQDRLFQIRMVFSLCKAVIFPETINIPAVDPKGCSYVFSKCCHESAGIDPVHGHLPLNVISIAPR